MPKNDVFRVRRLLEKERSVWHVGLTGSVSERFFDRQIINVDFKAIKIDDNLDGKGFREVFSPKLSNAWCFSFETEWYNVHDCATMQRWPESLFQTATSLLFQNFWIQVRKFFKFVNPTPVQTPATIIHPTVIYPLVIPCQIEWDV